MIKQLNYRGIITGKYDILTITANIYPFQMISASQYIKECKEMT